MDHLECVTTKRNRWYWYLIVLFMSYIVANTLGAIPFMAIMMWNLFRSRGIGDNDMALATDWMKLSTEGIDTNVMLAVTLFIFIVLLVAGAFFIRQLQGRSWTEVVNGTRRVRWGHFFGGFAVWGAINVVVFAVGYVMDPDNFEFRFDVWRFIPLLLIAVTMIPIQAASEEFFFRGYLAQGVASWTHSRWWTLVVPSVLFGLMHTANPEVTEYGFWVMMPQYILLGAMFGLAALLDDGIEVAMGAHAVNNLLGAVLTTYKGAALQTDALFMAREIDPTGDLPGMMLSAIVFVGVLSYLYKWKFGILNQPVPSPHPESVDSTTLTFTQG